MLLEMGAMVNAQDSDGRTPLHMCVESQREGTLSCMEVLFQYKTRVDDKDINGSTPLHRAAIGISTPVPPPIPVLSS